MNYNCILWNISKTFLTKFTLGVDMMKDKILMTILLLVGCALLYWGLSNQISLNERTKNYITIDGTIIDYETINSYRSRSNSYIPIISYVVNKNEYKIKPDYQSGYKPRVGTKKAIKYNQNNPNQAIIKGFNTNMVILYGGFLLTVGSLGSLLNGTKYKQTITAALLCIGSGVFFLYLIFSDSGGFDISKLIIIFMAIIFLVLGISSFWEAIKLFINGNEPQRL